MFSGNWRTSLVRSSSSAGRKLLGHLSARRIQVSPFTPAQIKLLETFADQAVIAIENVTAVPRTQRSFGAADGDERDLGVIASSPTDIKPVLDVVAENAARLCDATDAAIIRVEGKSLKGCG